MGLEIVRRTEGEGISSLVRDLVRTAEQTRQRMFRYDKATQARGERAYQAFIRRMASLNPEERTLENSLELIEAINRKPDLKDLPPLYTINTRTAEPSGVSGKKARLVVVKIVPETSPERTYQEAAGAGWAITVGANMWDTPEGSRYLPGLIYLFKQANTPHSDKEG